MSNAFLLSLPPPALAPSFLAHVALGTAHAASGPDLLHFVVEIQRPAKDHRTYAKAPPNGDPSALTRSVVGMAVRWVVVDSLLPPLPLPPPLLPSLAAVANASASAYGSVRDIRQPSATSDRMDPARQDAVASLFVRVPAGQGQQGYRTTPETGRGAFLSSCSTPSSAALTETDQRLADFSGPRIP
uniref:Putative secreted protein n=1 Tax=Anopheles triannulatus TaxID=58253 RepID=A0A2M4B221_9DIPT